MTGRLVVVVDVWLTRDNDGKLWSTHPTLSMATLARYLQTGRDITLVARFEQGGTLAHPLDEGVLKVVPIHRDSKKLALYRRVLLLLRGLAGVRLSHRDVVVLRLPELVSSIAWFVAALARSTRVVNVVADVGSVDNRFDLRGGKRVQAAEALIRWMVRRSQAAIYVSESSRARYPARVGTPTLVASNVNIDGMTIAATAKDYGEGPPEWTICSIGSQDSAVKGHDLLIRAVGRLRAAGHPVRLSLVGDGIQHQTLRELARDLDLTQWVTFHGFVKDRDALQRVLTAADLYVQPSRSEGLPRALLEAMAQGLCSLGSNVGGIPDLLSADLVFNAEDVPDQAEAIRRLIASPARATEAAEDCLATARRVLEAADPTRVGAFLRSIDAERGHSS